MTKALHLSRDEIEIAVREYRGPFDIEDVEASVDSFMSGWVMPRAVEAEAGDTDFEGIAATAREILTGMFQAQQKAPPLSEVDALKRTIAQRDWSIERQIDTIEGYARRFQEHRNPRLDELQSTVARLRVHLENINRIAARGIDADDKQAALDELARIELLSQFALDPKSIDIATLRAMRKEMGQ